MEEERRQARLRQEYATLYPGIPANEWRPVGELLDCVASARLQSGRHSGELPTQSGSFSDSNLILYPLI
jgi:hypothetical protein